MRRRVAQRANGRCEYCRCPEAFSLDTFTIDHIDPTSGEGENAANNLAHACHNCNNRKQAATAAEDPDTGLRAQMFNPRLDPWPAHFEWSADHLRISGRTPTGRATLAHLQLNRPGAVNIRRALLKLGELHPPPGVTP